MMDRIEKLESDVDELAAVVLGTPKSALEGGGRHDDGLASKIDHLWAQAQNGGLKARVPWVKMIAAFSGIATAVATIAVAILEKI